jgi:arylsulfatase A-like enzyme
MNGTNGVRGVSCRLAALAIVLAILFMSGREPSRANAQQSEPRRGVIGRTYKDSKPKWDLPAQAPKGSPNVIYLVLDDVGYAQLGCYGSEIATPTIDRLAAGGLRYTNFHTTALCSPSRACLLTGHNHHTDHMGVISEAATGYPGYDARMPPSQATIAEMLKQAGYSTFYVGKWHQTPPDETSDSGPYDHWPLGMGFERFYGFIGGETNQWFPDLVYDNHRIDRPNKPGYHLTEDLTDRAIQFIAEQKQITPDKPFFMNLAYGAAHAPHHVAKSYIEKYRGKFDKGWDTVRDETLARQKQMGIVPQNTRLAPRNSDVKPWDELTNDQRRLYARMEEVFAGFLTHCDENIGRLISFLEDRGLMDNTLLIVVSDNGASQEGRETGTFNESLYFNQIPENVDMDMKLIDDLGGPMTYPHYPLGWAMAGNTPFKRYKQETHAGGITDPLIIHWPKVIKDKGAIRTQYHHMIDITPTVLDVLGLQQPRVVNGVDQRPMEGVSMAYSFDDAKAPSRRDTQYYEMLGHRAIYHKGWEAVTVHVRGEDFDKDRWELYNVDEDFSESSDLAEQSPAKLREMIERWWNEAGRFNVLPLDDRGIIRAVEQPGLNRPRTVVTYYPGMTAVPRSNMLNFRNRSYSITAEVEIPKRGAEGVLVALGGRFGGFSLFIQNNRLGYAYNWVGLDHYIVTSTEPVPAGPAKLRLEFSTNGPASGTATLFVNDRQVGVGKIDRLVPFTFGLSEGLTVGSDPSTPVTETYQSPFEFTGKIRKVVMELKEDAKRASTK